MNESLTGVIFTKRTVDVLHLSIFVELSTPLKKQGKRSGG